MPGNIKWPTTSIVMVNNPNPPAAKRSKTKARYRGLLVWVHKPTGDGSGVRPSARRVKELGGPTNVINPTKL